MQDNFNSFIFGTKAENLQHLYFKQKELNINILYSYFFTLDRWEKDYKKILTEISESFKSINTLIVRSSSKREDSSSASMAGKFLSEICDNNEEAIHKTVCRVIDSYGEHSPEDQVLVQECITRVDYSGVAFTRDINTGGKYYIINYDDTSDSTSAVTSGSSKKTKLFYWYPRNNEYLPKGFLRDLCETIDRLIEYTNNDSLDVEFLYVNGMLYILQLRPLVIGNIEPDDERQHKCIERIVKKIINQNHHKLFLYGEKTVYGVMPDWNPAEMIGIHPRPLAHSLYKELITDEVWAYQRDNYGYKRLRSFPLMLDFCGYPYIDVRVSFNSFIPKSLDSEIAEKLVNYYLDRLREEPEKHDKIEFEIVFSCYTFDIKQRIQVLSEYGFSNDEIQDIVASLRILTKKIIDNEHGLWREDIKKVEVLKERHDSIIANNDLNKVEKIFWLLEDCKRYGTLPFAGLARAAFIAVQLLDSMVSEGIITKDERDCFIGDLSTVSSLMKNDYHLSEKEEFLGKYGFLRPGTYDICSERYDENPEKYFKWENKSESQQKLFGKFRLSLDQMQRIRDKMLEHDMGDDVIGLFSFLKSSMEGREKAKFIFTQNISDILRLINEIGNENGFTREDLSYLDINSLKDLYSGTYDIKDVFRETIKKGRDKYEEGEGLILPPLIIDEKDVISFFMPDSRPNYITTGRVYGDLALISHNMTTTDFDHKILLIESADPGYDWIFSHNISGFITKYGGANSHMAIRAGEQNIPAVIGVGEVIFSKLLHAKSAEIDAPKKIINIID